MIYLSILFLVFFMPCILAIWCISNHDKYVLPVVCSGFMTGVLVSVIISIFGSTYRLTEYSFGSNFGYIFSVFYILPALILYVVYFFVTKDPVDFRIKCFFPLTVSFYSVYVPYITVSAATERLPFFGLFYRPSLCIAMLMLCSVFVRGLIESVQQKNCLWVGLNAFFAVVSMIVPSCLDTFWIFGAKTWLIYLACFVYFAFAVIFTLERDLFPKFKKS